MDLLGLTLPLAATGAALAIHLVGEKGGGLVALPLIPLAVMPSLSANRLRAAFGIGLAVLTVVAMMPRVSMSDTLVSICLLVVAGCLSFVVYRCYRALLPAAAPGPTTDVFGAVFGVSPLVMLNRRGEVVSMTAPASRMFDIEPHAATGRPFAALVDRFVLSTGGPPSTAAGRWLGRRSCGGVFPLDISSSTIDRGGASLSVLHLSKPGLPAPDDAQTDTDLNHRVWRLNSLGLMAATLAHELSQPLTAAASYLHAGQIDMARAGVLGDSASRTLDLAKHQIVRASEIIGKLHTLLAPDSGNRRPEQVSAIIGELKAILGPLCRDGGVTLQVSIDTGSDLVWADHNQIQQVIVNLVRNAVQAVSDQVDRNVMIRGRPLTTGVYEISIEDSGPGLGRVNQVSDARPGARTGGLGLGLSVARSLIERQGGFMTVARSEGLGGAAVRFTLQRARRASP